MALDVDAVGKKSGEKVHSHEWKDVVLYALGCGARGGELDYLYEGREPERRGPRVLPSYAVVPTFPAMFEAVSSVGGNVLGLVHGSEKIRLHKPFTPSGRLTSIGEVAGVYDLRKMAQVVVTTKTWDDEGDLVCETEAGIIFRLDGNFDGPPPPASEHVRPPDRAPDWRHEQATSAEQALLYRLNGDLNPLHADPELAKASGFERPILHGLCTYGHMGRAALIHAADGDPTRIAVMGGQFRKPVFPGDTLVTEGWRVGRRVVLKVFVKERGDAVIQNAWVDLA